MSDLEFDWDGLREWYYGDVRRKPWDGRHCTKPRRGDQRMEQMFFDRWRAKMGSDAPFMNVDMLGYDQRLPIMMSDVKVGTEQFDDANQEAFLNLASMSDVPAYRFRWIPSIGGAAEKIIVTNLFMPLPGRRWHR